MSELSCARRQPHPSHLWIAGRKTYECPGVLQQPVPGDDPDGKYGDVIRELRTDHPWIPGAMFTKHPELRLLLIAFLRLSGQAPPPKRED